ncbi:uncharacterized protein PV09_08861 [Verruconis gallopava]|uniref:tyrosinase n=1 Tax=Verruconis gallopava TaxID=253628 RepID=A0A0D1ZZE1_9PEZI|nr:uncharacterized protein PV09_08861 [Verruconis gallopava]KIV99429.1 hypothetical protein PV09_08861 [Verruconis gallopava]
MRSALFAAAAALMGSAFAARDTISVTGATTDGLVGVRRELTELATDTDAFNLYLLAMNRYMNADTSDVLSFYQVSGVHGVPCQPWSGVQGNQAAISQGGCGYCTHSSTLFPAWHRAYVAAYEQGFYEQVQGVISDFASNPTQQAIFQKAASGLRIAYWDWAAAASGKTVPSILIQPKVTVPSPSGGSQTIDNPFYQYKFQILTQASTGGAPWINWPDTVRCPDSSTSGSDLNTMVNNIQSAFTNIQALTYKMLLNCAQWEEMADDSAATSSEGCSAGLESIHDQVHMNIGGNGHMGDLGHAGFDPAFWLHHANVDRLLALWQIAQDKTWFSPGLSGVATYTTPANEQVDGTSPLTPFYKDASSQTFWTPNEVEDWTTFGYTYPEVMNGLSTDKSSVISAINSLYGTQTIPPVNSGSSSSSSSSSAIPSATPSSPSKLTNSSISSTPASAAASSKPSSGSSSGSTSLTPLPSNLPSLLTPSGRTFDWSCSIVAERMGLGCSFFVYIFFGDVPADSSTWGSASNLVGSHGFFASTTMTATSGWLSSGSVALTPALVEQIAVGKLKSLDASVVEPFLHQKLNWAVKKVNGEVVDASSVPGLEITVVLTKLVPPASSNSAPTWEVPQSFTNVTSGLSGGYSGWTYNSGYSSGSSSGSMSGSSSSPDTGSCIPQVKYVYEYVYV